MYHIMYKFIIFLSFLKFNNEQFELSVQLRLLQLLEQTAHLLLLLHKHFKVLVDDGDSQQYASTTTNSTCTGGRQ